MRQEYNLEEVENEVIRRIIIGEIDPKVDDVPPSVVNKAISQIQSELKRRESAEAPKEEGATFGQKALATGAGALQGATLGFADEAAAALGAVGAKAYDVVSGKGLTKGESVRDLYKEAKGISREQFKGAEEEAPGYYLGGEIAGSIVGPGAVATKGIKQAVGVGAATGGVAGLGYSEAKTIPELAGDVAKSTAAGGAIGGIVGGIGKGLIGAGRAATRVVKGQDPEKVLASRLNREKIPNMVQEMAAARKAGDKTVKLVDLDLNNDDVMGLARAVARKPGAKKIVSESLLERGDEESARVIKQLGKNISETDAFYGNLDDIAISRSKIASPIYEKAFTEAAEIDIGKLGQDPRIIKALQKGKEEYGVDPEAIDTSLEALDGAKKAIDDIISSSLRKGNNLKARAYLQVKSDLVDKLDAVSPSYKKAREVFSDYSSLISAQKEGLKYSTLTPEQLKIKMKSLDPSEKDAFLIGVRESLQKIVAKTTDTASPATKIFNKSFNKDQLKAILDEKQYAEFSDRMLKEIRANQAKNKIMAGSRTDFNLEDDGQIIDAALSGMVGGKLAMMAKGLSHVGDIIKSRYFGLTDANAKKIARMLVDQQEGEKALLSIQKMQKNLSSEKQRSIIENMLVDYIPRIYQIQQAKEIVKD